MRDGYKKERSHLRCQMLFSFWTAFEVSIAAPRYTSRSNRLTRNLMLSNRSSKHIDALKKHLYALMKNVNPLCLLLLLQRFSGMMEWQ